MWKNEWIFNLSKIHIFNSIWSSWPIGKFNDIRLSVRKTVELSDHSTRNADLLSNDLLTYIQKRAKDKTRREERYSSPKSNSSFRPFSHSKNISWPMQKSLFEICRAAFSLLCFSQFFKIKMYHFALLVFCKSPD